MQFCIETDQLRRALKELEDAESRGFGYCLATFELIQCGRKLSDSRAEFIDLWDRAHPTDGRLDWGRQGVSKRKKFVNGKLISLVPPEYPEDRDEHDPEWGEDGYEPTKTLDAIEAGKLITSPQYHGVIHVWKDGSSYRGCVMRHCQVSERLECKSPGKAIKWLESQCKISAG